MPISFYIPTLPLIPKIIRDFYLSYLSFPKLVLVVSYFCLTWSTITQCLVEIEIIFKCLPNPNVCITCLKK